MDNVRGTLIGAIALCIGTGAVAQTETPQPASEESNAEDPRPAILQSQAALLFMLSNGLPADSFRNDLDAYNAAFPAPDTKDIAAVIHKFEAEEMPSDAECVLEVPTKLDISSSTAAPAVRQYIASGAVTNAWIVSHQPKGCGDVPARIYTIAQEMDGSLAPIRIGTGETLINLNIHYDLANIFRGKMAEFYTWKKADCSVGPLMRPTMRVISKSGDWGEEFYGTHLSGKWREEWTFQGCGGTAIIPIDMEWKGATNTEYLVQFPEATFTPDS